MARLTPSRVKKYFRRQNGFTSSLVTLAWWSTRRTWFLLLMTTLGVVATVTITCAVPLFSTVTTTAALRSVLREPTTNSDVDLSMTSTWLSTRLVHDLHTSFDTPIQHALRPYLNDNTQLTIHTHDFSFPTNSDSRQLVFYGTSLVQAKTHITLLQGRLPHENTSKDLEILLTPLTAATLNAPLNSVLLFKFSFYTKQGLETAENNSAQPQPQTVTVKAHVVGIFDPSEGNASTYWHGESFDPNTYSSGTGKTTIFTPLVSNDALLRFYDTINSTYHVSSGGFSSSDATLDWYYALDPSRIDIAQLNMLITQLAYLHGTVSKQVGDQNGSYPYSYLNTIDLAGPSVSTLTVPSVLENLQARVMTARIPIAIIAFQILALLLFFVSIMTDMLVDYQSNSIALVHSRGASRSQIFGSQFVQSLGVCLLATVLGLPFALVLVQLIAAHTLLPTQTDAINALTNTPIFSIFLSVAWYIIAIVFVILATMSFSLIRATTMNVLSTRRETTRSTRRALWQRLYLDVVFGIVALIGYLLSVYLTTLGPVLNGATKTLISAPLSLIAPFFLILGCILLSLRCFPLLLRFTAWLATRSRSAISLLALAQMARSPRQPVRLALLLALTIAFALFSLIFTTSQEQRSAALVAYETGADFSGIIPSHLYELSPHEQEEPYLAIPGVITVSAGYSGSGVSGDVNAIALPMQVRAVDTNSFAQTVISPTQASSQSLNTVLSQLNAQRTYGISHGVVPVIVDAVTLRRLSLHIGTAFTITLNNLLVSAMHCFVIGSVEHIPTVNDSSQADVSADNTSPGGVLADYQTYSTVYAQDVKQLFGPNADALPLNYTWLRTQDSPLVVTHVRNALTTSSLYLIDLQDRRALLEREQSSPLFTTLVDISSVGAGAALLLALLGNLLASWVSVHARITTFAILRAIGTSLPQVFSNSSIVLSTNQFYALQTILPPQVIVIYEQSVIYAVGLLLGVVFGGWLAITVVPTQIVQQECFHLDAIQQFEYSFEY